MHFIVKYDRKNGKVVDVIGFKEWEVSFREYQQMLLDESNPDVSVSLIDAPNRISLQKMFGAFFH